MFDAPLDVGEPMEEWQQPVEASVGPGAPGVGLVWALVLLVCLECHGMLWYGVVMVGM